jgi:hypothetical protein
LEEKLIGFRFTMEDWKAIVVEAEDSITITKQELKVILQQKHKLKKKVICFVMILHLIWHYCIFLWVMIVLETYLSIFLSNFMPCHLSIRFDLFFFGCK